MIKLQQGDYIYVRDMDNTQIEDLVKCFVVAGASDRDKGAYRQKKWPWLIWDEENDVWCTSDNVKREEGRRELTVDQVMGAACKPEAPKWGGEGLPPVGQRVRIVTAEGDQGCAEVVGHHLKGCVVWQHSDMEYHRWHPEFIRPLRSEEDRAVEEMMKEHPVGFSSSEIEGVRSMCRVLYRAGYRKTEK